MAKFIVKGREGKYFSEQEIQSYIVKGMDTGWGKELRLIVQFAMVASVRTVYVDGNGRT